MDKYECSICDNTFDDAACRPRALPCGHGFCTQCIAACISKGNRACPICREEHGANSANELPVSFLLEGLLQKGATSSSQQPETNSSNENGSVGMCSKHKGIPLYFICKSHYAKICHSCAVLDHPPASCNLISLDDEIKAKRQEQVATAQKLNLILKDTENDLEMLFHSNIDHITEKNKEKQNLEKEVESLLQKIEQIQQEVMREVKSQGEIKDGIHNCQMKQKSIDTMKNNLNAATNYENIVHECNIATTKILQAQKWEETLKKELNVRKNDKYAQLERDGIVRSCQIIREGGKTFVPNLSKEVKPPSSAKLIKQAELRLTSTTSTTTVWMDLSALGCSLGRVRISVMGNRPHGQQFIMLSLATDGPTFKGATFGGKTNTCIALYDYVTEKGSLARDGLLTTLKKEHYGKVSRGRIFAAWYNKSSFVLFLNDSDKSEYPGYFGDIITGMEVLDKATSDEYNIKDITISDCGILLDE
ncbi:unnamed protein product [Meganyctiphanes norvegica]|uniref:RING-type domain-containing protein n=1 Tax=Meganyctiphanes norvegica TaxID=48144 RepID=A0AAV2QLK0_MEGNR